MDVHFSRCALRRSLLGIGASVLGFATATHGALATPLPQGVTGALNHGATITISGSGFGSKAIAAPLAWDNASAKLVADVWTGAWPDKLPGYNIAYYSPMRGIGLPHSHDARYIAGAHAGDTGADTGYVLMWKACPCRHCPFSSMPAGTSALTTSGTSAATITSRPLTGRRATSLTPR